MTEALPIIDVGAFLEKRASAAVTARGRCPAVFSFRWRIVISACWQNGRRSYHAAWLPADVV